jgi:DNA-binding CsgD family transcriptional regulator
MPRGRPPTNDILTPREWQVLELLRQGLTNEQIASHLSIGYDGAKFHVSEIITKLGVKSRYEASRWTPEMRKGAKGTLPFSFRLPLATFAKLATGITGVVAVAVLVSALAVGLAGHSGPAALGQQVVVDWQVEELRPTPVRERSHPFRDNTGGVEDVWRGYVVHGGGQPQLVLESNRFLSQAPQWDEGGQQLTFSFTSLADGASSSFNMIAGRLSVDLLNGQTREKILERGNVSPRGDMITNDWRGKPSPYTAVVYVRDEMGVARRLRVDGRDIRAASWSPNGLWILAKTFDGKCSNRADRTLYYVLAAGADHAMSLGSFCRGGPIWSPEGNRLAI